MSTFDYGNYGKRTDGPAYPKKITPQGGETQKADNTAAAEQKAILSFNTTGRETLGSYDNYNIAALNMGKKPDKIEGFYDMSAYENLSYIGPDGNEKRIDTAMLEKYLKTPFSTGKGVSNYIDELCQYV